MHFCMPDALTEAADWTLIRSFIEVVRTGTLSAAARNLGQTQPTIGRQVRRLEELCGEPLFLRRGRDLAPTERAQTLYEQANALETEVTGLTRAFAAPVSQGPGTVRITTTELFASYALPYLLPPLLKADAGLEIEILASDRIDNLVRRDADMAVRFGRPVEPELIAVKVAELEVGLYASPELIATHDPPRNLAELIPWPWVGSRDASELIEHSRAMGSPIGRHGVRVRSDSLHVRLAAMEAGLGVGALVTWLADARPQLRRLLPDYVPATLPLWLVAHDDLNRSPRLRRVFDGLRAVLREKAARRGGSF